MTFTGDLAAVSISRPVYFSISEHILFTFCIRPSRRLAQWTSLPGHVTHAIIRCCFCWRRNVCLYACLLFHSFHFNLMFNKIARRKPLQLYEWTGCTIRYDSVCLTCSKKLTGSQLSLPHRTNKKLKCKTKNKMMSMIGPVQSRYREAVQ